MNELYHHGIKGQKWGVRRFQNPDGSLTPAGHQRYLNNLDREARSSMVSVVNLTAAAERATYKALGYNNIGNFEKAKEYEKIAEDALNSADKELQRYVDTGKKIIEATENVDKSGYSWKTTPMDMMSVDTTEIGKEFIKNNGRSNMLIAVNAARGNRFTVRQNVSEDKALRWANQRDIQVHKAQKVVYA